MTKTMIALALGLSTVSVLAGPPNLDRGKEIYNVNCMTCHGPALDGNGPAGQFMNPKPRDLVKGDLMIKKKNAKLKDDKAALIEVVAKGLPGTSMTAYGHLPKVDQEAVVDYIMSLRKK